MPGEYNSHGIRFQYPENWQVEEDGDFWTGRQSVTVFSPGAAFWSVSVYPRGTDPQKLADAAVSAMRQQYATLESYPLSPRIGGWESVGYEMNFFHLDLVCMAQVHAIQTDQGTYVFFAQGWDQEFEKLAMVFEAMTISCLSHIKKLSYWDE